MYILFTTLVYLIFFGCEGEGGWGEGGRSCEFAWEGEGGVEWALIRGKALINLTFSAFRRGTYSRWR